MTNQSSKRAAKFVAASSIAFGALTMAASPALAQYSDGSGGTESTTGAAPGDPVTVDPSAGTTDTLDPSSVVLVDPATGAETTTLAVAGQGVWSVDPSTGAITFTPEAGFTGNPAPVEFRSMVLGTSTVYSDTVTVAYVQTVGGSLAFTGSDSGMLVVVGAGAVALGGAAVWQSRRRLTAEV